jgi:uncharacterized membrane protein YraQ (UPF0718 family)
MEEIEITWSHVLKIWWAFTWRMAVFGFLIGGVLAIILGATLAAHGMTAHAQASGQLIGSIVGIPLGLWIIKVVLTTQFRDFRIALVPSAEALLERSVNESAPQRNEEK